MLSPTLFFVIVAIIRCGKSFLHCYCDNLSTMNIIANAIKVLDKQNVDVLTSVNLF